MTTTSQRTGSTSTRARGFSTASRFQLASNSLLTRKWVRGRRASPHWGTTLATQGATASTKPSRFHFGHVDNPFFRVASPPCLRTFLLRPSKAG